MLIGVWLGADHRINTCLKERGLRIQFHYLLHT